MYSRFKYNKIIILGIYKNGIAMRKLILQQGARQLSRGGNQARYGGTLHLEGNCDRGVSRRRRRHDLLARDT